VAAVYDHFAHRFFNQPDEQLGDVRETIGNSVQINAGAWGVAC
jgi:hypothetical protein